MTAAEAVATPLEVGPEEGELLVLLLDLNPGWWGAQLAETEGGQSPGSLDLPQFLRSVLALANAHLLLSQANEVALLGVMPAAGAHFLFPGGVSGTAVGSGAEPDGKFEPLAAMNEAVRAAVAELCTREEQLQAPLSPCLSVAGALGKALCYIGRRRRELQVALHAGSVPAARVLVLKGSEDEPRQYMNFMNGVFTAQKLQVAVDAVLLPVAGRTGAADSGLLAQAADITGGLCLPVLRSDALLQYLLAVVLPAPRLRAALVLPPGAAVDYRAACFCHRRLVDLGYVCSVCLSVFCTFSPICSTCNATFKMKLPLPSAGAGGGGAAGGTAGVRPRKKRKT